MRIAIFNFDLQQYHLARIKALACFNPDLHVILCTPNQNESNLANLEIVPSVKFYSHTLNNKSIGKLLEKINPNVVLSVSYAMPVMRAAAHWAKLNGRISICLTDSWRGNKPRFWPVEIYKGWLCKSLYDGMFVSGTRSLDYYSSLGFSEKYIWRGYDVVDNRYFAENALEVSKRSDEYREQYVLPKKYFLCIARFIPEKNLYRLLEAFRQYRQRQGNWSLVLIGDGPVRRRLEEMAKEIEDVYIYPWLDYSELPVFYGLASCFILASVSETWGLVVNEAMASGLPIALSRKCGSQPELCRRGINGIDFSPTDVDEIVSALFYFTNQPKNNLAEMGSASKSIIQQYTPLKASQALMDCITTLSRAFQ